MGKSGSNENHGMLINTSGNIKVNPLTLLTSVDN